MRTATPALPPLHERMVRITRAFATAPQLHGPDMAAAAQAGFSLILNARPDGEEDADEQPPSDNLAEAARAAGLAYVHIPIASGAAFPADSLQAAAQVLAQADGPVLGFCLTGMRALRLWALASALSGRMGADELIASAHAAGLPLENFREHLERLARGEPPLYVADVAAMMI